MKYVNKNTGDVVGTEVYSQLSNEAKNNFIIIKEQSNQHTTKTHQIIENRSDSMSLGDGIAATVLLPIAILSSIFD
jgi:hypothetical protein|tara:strand:- start:233 stop:460 length:228 start_codon:yes stop_codon:yes gene_type:complete